MNIYLDIDGTLIHKDGTPAEGLHQFLECMLEHHTCYWLTTHCRDGTLDHLYAYMSPKLPLETFELIKSILPTTWDINKTEAIDFTQDFRWYEDSPMTYELLDLKKYHVLDKLKKIDLAAKNLSKYTQID